MLLGIMIALGVIVFDQISKFLILNYVVNASNVVEICSFFNIVRAWNTGVSFSMFDDYGLAGVFGLVILALLIVAFLLYWLKSENNRFMQISLGFVIGGAIGNVIDRVRFGAVFDFLDVYFGTYHWPAFNVADSFICIGAVLIIYYEVFIKEKTK